MSHASEGLVTAALLSSTEELRAAGMEHEGGLDAQHPTVLGLVCSPSDGAYAYAFLDGGTRVVRRRASGDAISAEIEGEIEIELEIGTVTTVTPRCALSPHLPRWVLRWPAPPRLSPPSPRESAAPPRAQPRAPPP